MASVVTPLSSPLVPKLRALGLVYLLPIGLALAIVTWWPRPSPKAPPSAAQASAEDREDRERLLAIQKAQDSTVALEYNAGDSAGGRRVATGVVISKRGDVISVRVEPPEGRDRESIVARDSAGHRHPARWMAADEETGLTLLRVEADDIRPIRPTARAAILGAAIFLIGNPYRLGPSVSRGNIAGLDRRMEYGPRPLGGLIQLQVALHKGDSGALLADMKGGWLGLVRGGLRVDGEEDDNNLGFAIPAIDALWVANQLLAHRKVDRAFLGIKLLEKSGEPGAEVSSVVDGSPAEEAGLRPGDRVVRLDGLPIRTRDDLTDRLDRTAAGAEVSLEYARGPVLNRVTVRTIARSTKPPSPPDSPAPSPPPAEPATPLPPVPVGP